MGDPTASQITAALGDVTLVVQPRAKYPATPTLTVTSGRPGCAARVLAQRSLSGAMEILQVSAADACGSFSLQLVYQPVVDACRPGALYLVGGNVAGASYSTHLLASWNSAGEPVKLWITALDTPVIVAVATERPSTEPSWNEAGRWEYVIDVADPGIPVGCSLTRNLLISLQPLSSSPGPGRVYTYSITETNQAGRFVAAVTVPPGAPPVTLEAAGASRRIRVSDLDALRDAAVEARITFSPIPPFAARGVSPAPFVPAIRVPTPIPVPAPASGVPVRPAEQFLQEFLALVGLPLRTLSGKAEARTTADVSLYYALGSGPTAVQVSLPVAAFEVAQLIALDDQHACRGVPVASDLTCALVAAIHEFERLHPDVPESANYDFRFTFWDRPEQNPVLIVTTRVPRRLMSP